MKEFLMEILAAAFLLTIVVPLMIIIAVPYVIYDVCKPKKEKTNERI